MTVSWINAHNGFDGIWPALLTPLDAQLNIDHAKMAAHALALIDQGCGGVTAFGTTGEGPSFSMQERREAIDQLVEQSDAALVEMEAQAGAQDAVGIAALPLADGAFIGEVIEIAVQLVGNRSNSPGDTEWVCRPVEAVVTRYRIE